MAAAVVTISDLQDLERKLMRTTAPASSVEQIQRLQGWRRQVERDESFGRVLTGPQWIAGVSVMDGQIEGRHFTAEVVVSNLFTTAEAPADRWELDNTSFRAYSTVDGVPNTLVFEVDPAAGTIQLGAGAGDTITFSGGELSVPAASIGTLTIADIASGVIGGTYDSNTVVPRMRMSTAGIKAYNSGGTLTFDLDAATGDFDMIGNFTIASSAAASNRLTMNQSGIELWKSGVREFYLQSGGATNAITMLLSGPSAGQYIGMNPTDGLWLGASTFASAPLRITNAGIMTAIGATFQSGAANPKVELTSSGLKAYDSGGTQRAQILNDGSGWFGSSANFAWTTAGVLSINGANIQGSTITSSQISPGSITGGVGGDLAGTTITDVNLASGSVTNAKIDTVAASKITTGTITSQTITLGSSGILTLGTGAKIVDADTSEWNQSGLILKGATDSIQFESGGVTRGELGNSGSTMIFTSFSAMQIYAGSGNPAIVMSSAANTLEMTATSGTTRMTGSTVEIIAGGVTHTFDSSGRLRANANIFPGNQTTRYLGDNGSHLVFGGVDTAGSAGALVGYFSAVISGTARKIPYYAV